MGELVVVMGKTMDKPTTEVNLPFQVAMEGNTRIEAAYCKDKHIRGIRATNKCIFWTKSGLISSETLQ